MLLLERIVLMRMSIVYYILLILIVVIAFIIVLFKVIGIVINNIMIGFELNINGERISAGLEKGVVSIIVTRLSDELIDSIDLDFTGLNTSEKGNEETIDWHKSKLKVGDELAIKVKDIITNSSPIEIRKKNRDSENERKLKSYHALKKELESKGLI